MSDSEVPDSQPPSLTTYLGMDLDPPPPPELRLESDDQDMNEVLEGKQTTHHSSFILHTNIHYVVPIISAITALSQQRPNLAVGPKRAQSSANISPGQS